MFNYNKTESKTTIPIFLAMIALLFLTAYILTQFWGWFIVPFGIKQIGLYHAMGIMLIVSFLKLNSKKSDDVDWDAVFRLCFYILTFWGFGYLVHLGMISYS